jgi:hypothetical protein
MEGAIDTQTAIKSVQRRRSLLITGLKLMAFDDHLCVMGFETHATLGAKVYHEMGAEGWTATHGATTSESSVVCPENQDHVTLP